MRQELPIDFSLERRERRSSRRPSAPTSSLPQYTRPTRSPDEVKGLDILRQFLRKPFVIRVEESHVFSLGQRVFRYCAPPRRRDSAGGEHTPAAHRPMTLPPLRFHRWKHRQPRSVPNPRSSAPPRFNGTSQGRLAVVSRNDHAYDGFNRLGHWSISCHPNAHPRRPAGPHRNLFFRYLLQ